MRLKSKRRQLVRSEPPKKRSRLSVEKETALSLLKLYERVCSVQNSNEELSAAEMLVALADTDFNRKQEETECQSPFTSQSPPITCDEFTDQNDCIQLTEDHDMQVKQTVFYIK